MENIVEKYTKTSEKLEYQGEGLKCRKCSLWVPGGGCRVPKSLGCPVGEGYYFSTVRLWGSKVEFMEYQAEHDVYGLAGEVWDWTEKAIKEKNGRMYLKMSFELMDQFLGDRENWPEAKETIIHLGPDSYQLNVEREKTDGIFQLWWHLVKYQYNKRHPRGNKKKKG